MYTKEKRVLPREQHYQYQDTSLGLVSTQSFPAIVGTADMMLKSAGVALVGFEKIGSGHCTAIIRGKVADVRLAIQTGVETALKFGQEAYSLVIPRPSPNLEAIFPIGSRLLDVIDEFHQSRLSNQAVGLLETIGFPAMVGACDAMLKCAHVHLASYETIGKGLCTAIIRGSVADVAVAVEAGMHEAEKIGQFHSLMVIPRPLDDLEKVLPISSCWIEDKPRPVQIPLRLNESAPKLLELPDLATISVETEEDHS